MIEELKACPFCGIKPELASLVTPVRYFYLCPNCGIGNELQGFDRDEARRFWNTRPIEDELRAELARRDEIIARLKEALPTFKRDHYYCEDCWYSCPKEEDGCCDDGAGEDCNCGADEWNARIDLLMKELEC